MHTYLTTYYVIFLTALLETQVLLVSECQQKLRKWYKSHNEKEQFLTKITISGGQTLKLFLATCWRGLNCLTCSANFNLTIWSEKIFWCRGNWFLVGSTLVMNPRDEIFPSGGHIGAAAGSFRCKKWQNWPTSDSSGEGSSSFLELNLGFPVDLGPN